MLDIGVIQLTSLLNYEENLKKIKAFLQAAKDKKIKYVFLPECFYSMSDGTRPTPHLIDDKNEHYQNIKKLAQEFGVYLLAGSAATKYKEKVINRNFNFAPDGSELDHYDKIHLFSCDIQKENARKTINEADIYTPGSRPQVLQVDDFKIGLGICFDLRFSYMADEYRKKGCNLLTYSSAFTVPTGRAHWHILLRARAIENQLFVVAPAQWGKHNDRIQTFGHSLIIDPWGNILADAGEGEKLITASIDLQEVDRIRATVKMNY